VPGYSTRTLTVAVGAHRYRLRVLSDNQQFSDPDGHGERLGISSAQWSHFGQLWPSARLLAEAMDTFDITGKRILEAGCGIGLASLVLQRRGADVVASDIHPLAEAFIAYNSALNDLPAVHYRQLDWEQALPSLGGFDVLIASDVLYEREHAALLAALVMRHANPVAEVVVADPGRGNNATLVRLLEVEGFGLTQSRGALKGDALGTLRGRLLHFRR
jgi:predicted nicotinamide N-methyase